MKESVKQLKKVFKKFQKIKDYLELHVRKTLRRNFDFHQREPLIYTNITIFDAYLKDFCKMAKNVRIKISYREAR